jgi:hypothetical protein
MSNEHAELLEEEVGPAERQQVEGAGKALYFGDTGLLPVEARRTLVHLLQGPSIDHSRHPNLWNSLVRYEAVLRSRLADTGLDLLIDHEAKVAFPRQADMGDIEMPKLLREQQLRFYDSLVLLYLRQVLSHAEALGTRAVVSLDDILDHMTVYLANGDRLSTELRTRVLASVNRVQTKLSVLYKVPGNDERYEISRALKLMIGVDQVQALRQLYEAIAKGDLVAQAETTDVEEE